MADYLPGHGECRYVFATIAMWVFFFWDLFCLTLLSYYSVKYDRTDRLLSVGFYATLVALTAAALCESLFAARAIFYFTLFCQVLWVCFNLIVLCFTDHLAVQGIFKEAVFITPKEAQWGVVDVILALFVYIAIVALVLRVYWVYGNYLKAKKSVTVAVPIGDNNS